MAQTAVSDSKDISKLCINAIRILSMDAVQKAKSGHPGTPMGLAPLGYVLWTRHLRHNPGDPSWINRDRFVLSCGHASMLLYSLLYLSGYDISLGEIRNFRQWGSRTPGHPEFGHTPGVETTTGPLGQGVGNAVGLAAAEAQLAARFCRTGHYVIDHHTYFVASDGDLMEGVSHEVASLAGHLRLGKLIGFYDDNKITIEGERHLADSEDVARRFEAYGWSVETVEDGNDLQALDDAIEAARAELVKPSLIIVKTHIAYGSPNKQDSADAHGAPLGEQEVELTRENLGWQWSEEFYVPPEVLNEWQKCKERGAELQAAWKKKWSKYEKVFPADFEELTRRLEGRLAPDWAADLPSFDGQIDVSTRLASGRMLNAVSARVPELIGGSADLGPSNNTLIDEGGDFAGDKQSGRNIHFGVREHGMGAIMNGMALHGGVIPYGGTFLVFSDYMRPSLRLAAMMGLRTIHVYTHDSVGLGEDGPTHQPVEQLASLRAIPGFTVIRPADARETVEAWKVALERDKGPVALVLTRQKVPQLDRSRAEDGLAQGAYVLSDPPDGVPRLILMGSGSEVHLLVAAEAELAKDGVRARVVSMPSMELFAEQRKSVQDEVLPPSIPKRLAVEAASPLSWYPFVGEQGDVIGMDRFGASAPYERIFEELNLTVEEVVRRARRLVE